MQQATPWYMMDGEQWITVDQVSKLLGSLLAACEEGDFAQYADACPAGTNLQYEHSKGAAICVH